MMNKQKLEFIIAKDNWSLLINDEYDENENKISTNGGSEKWISFYKDNNTIYINFIISKTLNDNRRKV